MGELQDAGVAEAEVVTSLLESQLLESELDTVRTRKRYTVEAVRPAIVIEVELVVSGDPETVEKFVQPDPEQD